MVKAVVDEYFIANENPIEFIMHGFSDVVALLLTGD